MHGGVNEIIKKEYTNLVDTVAITYYMLYNATSVLEEICFCVRQDKFARLVFLIVIIYQRDVAADG